MDEELRQRLIKLEAHLHYLSSRMELVVTELALPGVLQEPEELKERLEDMRKTRQKELARLQALPDPGGDPPNPGNLVPFDRRGS